MQASWHTIKVTYTDPGHARVIWINCPRFFNGFGFISCHHTAWKLAVSCSWLRHLFIEYQPWDSVVLVVLWMRVICIIYCQFGLCFICWLLRLSISSIYWYNCSVSSQLLNPNIKRFQTRNVNIELIVADIFLQTTHSRELQDVLKFIGEWCGTPPGFSF